MDHDLLYRIALTLVPNIGPVQSRILAEHFNSARDIFKSKLHHLTAIEGIGEIRAKAIKSFNNFKEAEKEISFIEKYAVTPLFLKDTQYPKRLLNCYDSPTMLYYKGNADLNASRIVAVIGTRNNSDYGKQLTEKLIQDLAKDSIIIVSGLAYGIDAIAHKTALKNHSKTIGVLAHGLDQVYPSQHISLAKEMLTEGGLLTEFRSGVMPDKHNFPTRNRIVAGISDAIVVIETGTKGGSMITVELANGYNKDVFAFPGRIGDPKSMGCNELIRDNKAVLLTDAKELISFMGWEDLKKPAAVMQKQIFVDLDPGERVIVDILKEKEWTHIDEIRHKSRFSTSHVASIILNLELRNVVHSQPGKLYSLH